SREATDGGGVGKKIKLQILATEFRRGAKELTGHNERRFTVKFNDFRDRVRVPSAKLFDYNLSVLPATVCHVMSELRRPLLVPVQRALLPKIEIPNQKDCNVQHHFIKAITPELAENHRPRVKENRFHVEKNKDHRDEVKFDGEGLARVAGRLHATFVSLLF